MRGAMIGGEIDGHAALLEHDRQRFGRKQMTAGTAGGEEDQFASVACGHDLSAVMPGHSRPEGRRASHAYVPGIHVVLSLN
jgi:hypothetical protein